MTQTTEPFATWAILEIMGHQRFAGYITEQTIGGAAMLRIDVPAIGVLQAFTRYFGAHSVYSITPCTEELARELAAGFKRQPVNLYDLPEELQEKLRRPRPALEHQPEFFEEDDDEPF